ncbi:hypothetical protein HWV62_37990 [Athelia sp. TMB]|nr:hypothetical protein HWV62_37990 [Athelia sp. TMB]
MKGSAVPQGKGEIDERDHEDLEIQRPAWLRFVPTWLREAIELCGSMRGIGWDFGVGVFVPPHQRPLQRALFIRATIYSVIQNVLNMDILDTFSKLLPGVGDTSGGSIFYSQLPPLQRYAVSTAIQMISSFCLIEGFAICYDSLALFGVVALNDPPSSWPPLMNNPWASTSLHEFWAKRWHQLMRRTFIVAGGFPGKFIAGNTGMVFGTFIASGLFHELAIYAMGRGLDYRVVLFFAIQGPLLTVESYWRKLTGKMVGGWAGRIWVFLVLSVLGQGLSECTACLEEQPIDHYAADSWHRRGLAGGMFFPPEISPIRVLVIPTLSSMWKK